MPSSNPEIVKERLNLNFDVEELSAFIYGGKDKLRRKRYIENLIINDPVFKHERFENLDRNETYEIAMRKNIHAVKLARKYNLAEDDLPFFNHIVNKFNEHSAFGLHSTMFIPTLRSQMTAEQQATWLTKAENYEIIGTYAQTEMGHGTFIRGMETTATFDPSTDEFIIHSPTLTSIKWWPGNLGKGSNFCVVLCQLYTQNEPRGPHLFLVQLRSLHDHQPLPGITVGDIGAKFGTNSNDNGFLKFEHVRIPRDQMLMKYAKVSRDGSYERSGDLTLTYLTMVLVRSYIVLDAARSLAAASTISVRYSSIRHQTEMEPGAGEPQILDYQTQQYKLLPLVASAYAFIVAGRRIRDNYHQVNEELGRGFYDNLQQLHALSAGMKAFSTHDALKGIIMSLRSCGGHGFSHASGIPHLYFPSVAACIYEGENTVMLLQTARFLVKAYARYAMEGVKLTGIMEYINEENLNVSMEEVSLKTRHLPLIHKIVKIYQVRAARAVKRAAMRLQDLTMSQGKSQGQAAVLSGQALVNAALAHCHLFTVKTFAEAVPSSSGGRGGDGRTPASTTPVPAACSHVLNQLVTLYGLYGIVQKFGNFADILPTSCKAEYEDQIYSLLAELRPISVSLVDAFDISDHTLNSVLGRSDGRVYENMLEYASHSALNKSQVHDAYYKYQRDFLRENAAAAAAGRKSKL